jgi:CheY-like chemotaxis protein
MKKLLIVDDERDTLDSLSEFLQDEGYEVSTALNGALALDHIRAEGRPCALILDLAMPVMTGNELYAHLQADPALSALPVMFFTSDPSKAPSGVPILKKPAKLEQVLSYVKRYCN